MELQKPGAVMGFFGQCTSLRRFESDRQRGSRMAQGVASRLACLLRAA